MAKVSKAIVDKGLRESVFDMLFSESNTFTNMFNKVNDRQYGIIMVDANGVERYVRIGAIVAEEREDMTARELMESEIEAYNVKQEAKAEKAKAKAEKIAADAAKRKAKKEQEENESRD